MNDLARVPILEVWQRLGGAPLRHGRAAAFWRRGDNPGAVSVDSSRNLFFDFVAGSGGGVLDLVQTALSVDKPGALRWLECEGLLQPMNTTSAERRAFAARRGRAQEMARLASRWLSERLAELDEAKRAALSPFDPWALQAAASEHFRLSTLDEGGVIEAWLTARKSEPMATRQLERQGERWEEACQTLMRHFVKTLGEASNAA